MNLVLRYFTTAPGSTMPPHRCGCSWGNCGCYGPRAPEPPKTSARLRHVEAREKGLEALRKRRGGRHPGVSA